MADTGVVPSFPVVVFRAELERGHAPLTADRLWTAYWFPLTSNADLAGARIVAVAVQVFWRSPPPVPSNSHHNSNYFPPPPLIRLTPACCRVRDFICASRSSTGLPSRGLAALGRPRTRTSLLIPRWATCFVTHRILRRRASNRSALRPLLLARPFPPRVTASRSTRSCAAVARGLWASRPPRRARIPRCGRSNSRTCCWP